MKTNEIINQTDDDKLEKNEIEEIAGYNPDESLYLEEEYRILTDDEAPSKPISEKATLRTGTVLFLTGCLILVGLGLWFGIQPKSVKKTTEKSLPSSESIITEEKPDFRAKLALKEQESKNKLQVKPLPKPKRVQPKQSVQNSTLSQQPSSKSLSISPSKPLSKPPSIPQTISTIKQNPPIVKSIPSFSSPVSPPIKTSTKKEVDPFTQWNKLAQLGQTQTKKVQSPIERNRNNINESDTIKSETNQNNITKFDNTKSNESIQQIVQIPVVNIGEKSVSDSDLSEGTRGILNRTPIKPTNKIVKQVAIGTTASANISVPLIWDSSNGEQLYNRFALTLTENLLAIDQQIALPIGTVLIAQADNVGKENLFVQATAIAIVYPNSQGEVVTQSIPVGTILIQGKENKPLIAQNYLNSASDALAEDLLISVLSGIGRVGEVFTKPQETSTFSNNNISGSSNSTVIRSREPQIWSAVLDGFFNPLQSRIAKRSDQEIKELLTRPNVAVIPTETEVSIVVNSFINITDVGIQN